MTSPSEKGLFRFTILWDSTKLAKVASSCIKYDCLVETVCCFFKLLTNSWHFLCLSSFIKLCPKSKCFVWWCLLKLYSLKTLTHSRHSKQTALLPTFVKQYLAVHSSLKTRHSSSIFLSFFWQHSWLNQRLFAFKLQLLQNLSKCEQKPLPVERKRSFE